MAVKKEINWDLVELYIKSGSTQLKIAQSLFIHPNTLADRVKEKYGMDYSTFSSALCREGELLIEAKQHEKAMKGFWPALQWLGKIRCGQKEPEVVQNLAANQTQIDKDHIIMQLQNEIEELKANADKSKTE
jgi:hypothetical protein